MNKTAFTLTLIAAAALASAARADVITDWNVKTHEVIGEAKIGTPPAIRITALVQTAALSAVESLPRGASPGRGGK